MFTELFENYKALLPLALISCVVAALLAPISAWLARAGNFIDRPTKERAARDHGAERRIHDRAVPKLGGLAVIIPVLVFGTIVAVMNNVFAPIQGVTLLIGLVLIAAYNIADVRRNFSSATQIVIQIAAALIVVAGGTRFTEIGLIGLPLDQLTIQLPLNLSIVLAADIVNILWILFLTNAINWVFSVDAAGEFVVLLTALGLVLANMKLGNMSIAMISVILFGAMLGYLPYNFPPAKMFSGTDIFYGFLLAVLSIVSSGKLLTASSMLAFPIIDMLWVILFRIRAHRTLSPRKLLSISDTSHLAHRLKEIGFSVKGILAIEIGIVVFSVVIALAILQFEKASLAAAPLVLVLLVFALVEFGRTGKRRAQHGAKKSAS